MKPTPTKEFRVKAIIDERLAVRKRCVEQRLDRNKLPADRSRPVLESPNLLVRMVRAASNGSWRRASR